MNTFFFSQDSQKNSHLLNFNTPSLAQKLLLHKIQHAPHPKQRETDKKKNKSLKRSQHRNFKNQRSHASCRYCGCTNEGLKGAEEEGFLEAWFDGGEREGG